MNETTIVDAALAHDYVEAWNTGCRYTAHGQRIAAQVVNISDDSIDVGFADIDRGIDGLIRFDAKRAARYAWGFRTSVYRSYVTNDYRSGLEFLLTTELSLTYKIAKATVAHMKELAAGVSSLKAK